MLPLSICRLRLPIDEARALMRQALARLGYAGEDGEVVVAHLIDAALCGYEYSGLPKILDAAANPQLQMPRQPMRVVHETPVSVLLDAGNQIGMLALQRATELAMTRVHATGLTIVGLTNSWMTGRSAYFMEQVARAGLVGVLTVATSGLVAPSGGIKPVLGTNPLAFGWPALPDPLVIDLSTSAISWADLALRAQREESLPEGLAIDANGLPTCDPHEAREGAILPFGGTKGFALSLAVQALGLLASARSIEHSHAGGVFMLVMRPDLLVPLEDLQAELTRLVSRIKASTPTGEDIRLPGERAFSERAQRLQQGWLEIDRTVYDRLKAL